MLIGPSNNIIKS